MGGIGQEVSPKTVWCNMEASSHVRLLKFKLFEITLNLKFSFSVTLSHISVAMLD